MDSKSFKNLLMFVAVYALLMIGKGVISGDINIIFLILWIMGITVALAIYFIPSLVARKNKHTQTTAITLLNIFLGWTFIGWVVALIWAVMKEKTSN